MKEYYKKIWELKKTIFIVFLFGLLFGFLISNIDKIKETKRIKFWEFEIEFANDPEKSGSDETQAKLFKSIDKVKAMEQINKLIEFGNNIPRRNDDKMRSASVYVFQEMQEIRNDTLSLMEKIGLKDSALYQETLNCPNIDYSLSPRALFASKHEFIDCHVAALKSLKKQLDTKN